MNQIFVSAKLTNWAANTKKQNKKQQQQQQQQIMLVYIQKELKFAVCYFHRQYKHLIKTSALYEKAANKQLSKQTYSAGDFSRYRTMRSCWIEALLLNSR